MESDDHIRRFIDFDASDVDRIRKLKENLSIQLDTLVEETCRELSVEASGEATDALQQAITQWLDGMFDEPFALRRTDPGELEALVHSASPWTECLLATLHRLRRRLGRHILESPDFDSTAQREQYHASLERVFDFEVLRLVRARHQADLRGRVQHMATLAAGLSHEIYNPLNSISLHLSLLERQLQAAPSDPSVQEGEDRAAGYSTVLTAVREELRRIGNFTSELSDFSRPLPMRTFQLDPRAFVGEFVETHAPTLETAGVDLTWSASAKTGPGLEADPDLLEEALLNLVENAVEAMETDGTIEVRISATPGAMHLDVVDSGPGFSDVAADRAFDLFFSTKAAGTGLGLPLVQKITRAHGGQAHLLSTPEKGGATVRLSLPTAASGTESADGEEHQLQELQRLSQH